MAYKYSVCATKYVCTVLLITRTIMSTSTPNIASNAAVSWHWPLRAQFSQMLELLRSISTQSSETPEVYAEDDPMHATLDELLEQVERFRQTLKSETSSQLIQQT